MATARSERRRSRARIAALSVLASIAVAVAAAIWRSGEWHMTRRLFEAPSWGYCSRKLDRPLVDRSLQLGQHYLFAHQRSQGNFDYEYDWVTGTRSADDNQVRQAGAVWGLSLLYQDRPSEELEGAVERALAYFDRYSASTSRGRCTSYPGDRAGKTGTVALVALAQIDFLRGARARLPAARLRPHEERLAGHLKHLTGAVNEAGLFHGGHDPGSCRPGGAHSPYSDGEALLALVKAARYAGHVGLESLIRRIAEAGHARNVVQALADDPDSDVTKGYYQWASMAFFELYDSGWPDTERYGDRVLALADWMIDVHRVLWRTRNTAYAFEGIIHAHEVARRRGDHARRTKYACVIDAGLERLLSLQVGHPLANRHVRRADPGDALALGGVQNSARDPRLRIDVTQHQLHAVLLARRHIYRE